jgi:hypothetical protein
MRLSLPWASLGALLVWSRCGLGVTASLGNAQRDFVAKPPPQFVGVRVELACKPLELGRLLGTAHRRRIAVGHLRQACRHSQDATPS